MFLLGCTFLGLRHGNDARQEEGGIDTMGGLGTNGLLTCRSQAALDPDLLAL